MRSQVAVAKRLADLEADISRIDREFSFLRGAKCKTSADVDLLVDMQEQLLIFKKQREILAWVLK